MARSWYIALLRGINVGGRNKIAMGDLRSLCSDLGWSEVRSYIQSGNLVFRADNAGTGLEARLEHGIEREFGLTIPVIIRDHASWRAIMGSNPFPSLSESEPNRVVLHLSKHLPMDDAAEQLQERASLGERIVRTGDAIWIHYAGGIGRSKITTAWLDRTVGSTVTARNWRTVVKIDQMAGES
jgi:uncharacterized protein (DUF1697 family)